MLRSGQPVQEAIKDLLDGLPEVYDIDLYNTKCDQVYERVYERYPGGGQAAVAG